MARAIALAFLVCFALASQAFADKPYTEFANINSRVPGDKLIWESSVAKQSMDFYATVSIDIYYPLDSPRSPYNITHIHIDAKETTGLMQLHLHGGGPGSDFMKLKLVANSVKAGTYKVSVYGLKK